MGEIELKEYVDKMFHKLDRGNRERIEALEELILAKLAAMQLAVDKSESAYNSRFALANEFRQAMSDLSGTFVTREVLDEKVERILQKISSVDDTLCDRIAKLEHHQSRAEGRAIGYSAGIGLVVLIVSIVISLLGLGG